MDNLERESNEKLQKMRDLVFAAGVMIAATEIMLEGKTMGYDGEQMLKKANSIIDKHNITTEELADTIREMRFGDATSEHDLKISRDTARYEIAKGVH